MRSLRLEAEVALVSTAGARRHGAHPKNGGARLDSLDPRKMQRSCKLAS